MALLVLVSAVGQGGPAAAGAPPAPPQATSCATSQGNQDWAEFGRDPCRTGYNADETVLGVGNAGGLHQVWSFPLDGVETAQPIYATDVQTSSGVKDLVLAGTAHGWLYAIDAGTGGLVWQRNLGSADTLCPDFPDGFYGVTGPPLVDRSANLLRVTGGDGRLYALNLSTGADLAGWPIVITTDPVHEHNYGSVTVWAGNAYVAIAGVCDQVPYHGRVVRVNLATRAITATWLVTGQNVDGGGIWGPGGVSVDPATAHVFAATGEAVHDPEYFGYADQVVELSGSLNVLGTNYPGLQGANVDFGATPILFQAPGCRPMVAAKNKSGVLVVYTRGKLNRGYTQRLQIATVGDYQFNGIPAWSPVTNLLYVSNSADSDVPTYRHGMIALRVTPLCKLKLAWQKTVGPDQTSVSPPVVANGVVYYGDGVGDQVFAFDAATGQQLWTSGTTFDGPIFAAPTVTDGRLFVGSWDETVRAFGP
jgi:outer membrane protein assembly factor BamB